MRFICAFVSITFFCLNVSTGLSKEIIDYYSPNVCKPDFWKDYFNNHYTKETKQNIANMTAQDFAENGIKLKVIINDSLFVYNNIYEDQMIILIDSCNYCTLYNTNAYFKNQDLIKLIRLYYYYTLHNIKFDFYKNQDSIINLNYQNSQKYDNNFHKDSLVYLTEYNGRSMSYIPKNIDEAAKIILLPPELYDNFQDINQTNNKLSFKYNIEHDINKWNLIKGSRLNDCFFKYGILNAYDIMKIIYEIRYYKYKNINFDANEIIKKYSKDRKE